ncbi:hypothetical protein [Nonomuraea sp. NPDC049400]
MIFLTHTHHDHAKDLDYLASRAAGTDIYLPAEALPTWRPSCVRPPN